MLAAVLIAASLTGCNPNLSQIEQALEAMEQTGKLPDGTSIEDIAKEAEAAAKSTDAAAPAPEEVQEEAEPEVAKPDKDT